MFTATNGTARALVARLAAAALTLSLLTGGTARADPKKLEARDFDLIARIERVEGRLDALEKKFDALAERKGQKAPAPPAGTPGGAWARPAGDGWQWDAGARQWWRVAPDQAPAPTPTLLAPAPACPTGRCPTR